MSRRRRRTPRTARRRASVCRDRKLNGHLGRDAGWGVVMERKQLAPWRIRLEVVAHEEAIEVEPLGVSGPLARLRRCAVGAGVQQLSRRLIGRPAGSCPGPRAISGVVLADGLSLHGRPLESEFLEDCRGLSEPSGGGGMAAETTAQPRRRPVEAAPPAQDHHPARRCCNRPGGRACAGRRGPVPLSVLRLPRRVAVVQH